MPEILTRAAEDEKNGLTLAELKRICAQADVLEMPADSIIKASCGWKQQIKELMVCSPPAPKQPSLQAVTS